MCPRLSEQTSKLDGVFFVSKSPLGIEWQKRLLLVSTMNRELYGLVKPKSIFLACTEYSFRIFVRFDGKFVRGRDSPCWPKGAWPLGQLANRFSSVPFHLTVSHTLLSKRVFVQVLLSYRSVCEDVYAGAVYANCLKHFGTGPACSKFSKATFIHRITSLFYLTNCTINFLFSFKLFNVIIHTATDHNEKKLPSYRTSPSRLAMDMNCSSLFL